MVVNFSLGWVRAALRPACVVLAVGALAACGGGSSSGGGGNGQLSLGVVDGPVEGATAVVVSFTGVELKPKSGDSVLIDFDDVEGGSPQAIDLIEHQGEERAMLLDKHTIDAGEYNWMRLAVDQAGTYIEIDGQQHELEVPSGAQSGFKLNRPFTVAVGTVTDFTVEFDLRKSVTLTGNGRYILRPTLRIVDSLKVNSISGTVSAGLIVDNESCSNGDNDDIGNAVYVFADAPQDYQGNDSDPITSATVTYNGDSGLYEFTVGFLPIDATYILAFTCDASVDVATEDNSAVVSFSTPQSRMVNSEPTTPIHF